MNTAQPSAARFGPGTTFRPIGKHAQLNTVCDVHTVTNLAGEVVALRYVATHEFCGQTVTVRDVADATIARGLVEAKPAAPVVNPYAAALRRLLNAGTYGRELLEAREEAGRLLGVKLPEVMPGQQAGENAAPTMADLDALAFAHSVRVQPSSRAGCFDLYWPAEPGADKREPHAFAVSIGDAIRTIRFNAEQDAARD